MKVLKINPLSRQGRKHGSKIQTETQGIEGIPKERRDLTVPPAARLPFCKGGVCVDLGRFILSLV